MTSDRPLTDLQLKVLKGLDRARRTSSYPMTPNEIGHAIGARIIQGGRGQGGRGRGSRTFGLAQQIIPVLTSLSRGRGLIAHVGRRDGRSGAAYALTDAGRRYLEDQPQPERGAGHA
jgi:hypothetical protein